MRDVIEYWVYIVAIVVNNDDIPLSEIKPMAADFMVIVCVLKRI